MDTITILQNQVAIMEALLCINEIPKQIAEQIKEQIIFTKARIKCLV